MAPDDQHSSGLAGQSGDGLSGEDKEDVDEDLGDDEDLEDDDDDEDLDFDEEEDLELDFDEDEDLEDDDDEDLEDEEFDDEETDRLVEAAVEALARQGPLSQAELARRLDVAESRLAHAESDARVVMLADNRLASFPALLSRTTLTHRLGAEEAATETLSLGVDLAPVETLLEDYGHLHLPDGGSCSLTDPSHAEPPDAEPPGTEPAPHRSSVLAGPQGWLHGASAGDLIGLRLAADRPDLRVGPIAEVPAIPAALPGQLQASFQRFGEGDGMPVRPLELLCQLAVDAWELVDGVLPPLSAVLEAAGFEVREGYTAPEGADWDAFFRIRRATLVGVSHGLDADEIRALVMLTELCRLSCLGQLDRLERATANEVGGILVHPELGEAFAEVTAGDPEGALAFLASARSRAAGPYRAGLAWAESLLAGRFGEPRRAERCLRSVLADIPDHPGALADAAWYASDRGDAAQAVQLLARLDEDPDEGRTAVLRRYAAGSIASRALGRNDPCPCGSGRKYKHCCLRAPSGAAPAPLPERVRWLWAKLHWWLERSEFMTPVLASAFELHGDPDIRGGLGFAQSLDAAASLVLFSDGAVMEFLRRRGDLLPDDERNLVSQWALAQPSVYEVIEVQKGEGVRVRDLRTGDVLDVRERRGSEDLSAGDLVFAHPVFDGEGYQFVGGLLFVPLMFRQAVMEALDGNASSMQLAAILGAAHRPPTLVNMEGEPTLLCTATYRVPDPAVAAGELDRVLEREDEGRWVEWVDVDDKRWLRSSAALEADQLTLSANSEQRFERVKGLVESALSGIELTDEQRREPAELIRKRRRGGGREGALDPGPSDIAAGSPRATSVGGGPGGLPPGAREALEAFVREQEQQWVDQPVPALAGLTPRQAAADPTRREDLLALLHEFERQPAPPGAVGFDVARLRALLELEEQ